MRLLDSVHVVRGFGFADANGTGFDSDIVSLKNFASVAVLIDFGTINGAADCDITFKVSDDVSSSNSATLGTIRYRKSPGSTSDDLFEEEATVTDSKIDVVATTGEVLPTTDNGCLLVVDFDAADLKAATTEFEAACLQVCVSDPGASMPIGCLFVLQGPRQSDAAGVTAITD